ncbi:carbohydrate binding domain-containing protein [Planctomicrobium piriforme]|uniref:Carbohydrate binding domain-containing protein n=1 Tax=Planctomicrobium piriforme TaxID=1576369 RepID=A0A1I3SI85_9PLAN|nr:carbohydrate binding domain-containing protein [Planctomicrobium piriforme]SFJ57351.1 Carbohydrate binding domain-containing protein [Planctomicrobium piriforme]
MKALAVCLLLLLSPTLLCAADAPNLLKPTNNVDSWRLEQIEGGKGTIKADGDAIVFEVTEVDGTEWHVQAFQIDLNLKEGQTYSLKFNAKASASRPVILNAMVDVDDWHELGLHEDLYFGTEYKPYEFTFTATGVEPNKNRIGFMFGQETGKIYVKEMTLTAK